MITKKRIRNSTNHLSGLFQTGDAFQVGIQLSGLSDPILHQVGFPSVCNVGDTILPSDTFGKVAKENCHGKFGHAKRNLPKVSFDVSYTSTIKDWHGDYHTVNISQTREKFQRDFYPPIQIELTVRNDVAGGFLLVTRAFTYGQDEDIITHAINLILEIAKRCEVFDLSGGRIINAAVQRVNWRMLPSGTMPWTSLQTHLRQTLTSVRPQHQTIVEARLKKVNSYTPSLVAVGLGGFSDYLAFHFPTKNLWLLECIKSGNATYVMGNNWQQISQLTKSDIINGNHATARIIHNENWEASIHGILH